MKRIINKIREKEGFTLAELLIVVAIIAVLVAIAIPVFTTQLEKSREGVVLSNVRAMYAEMMTAAVANDTGTITSSQAGVSINYDGTNKTYTATLTGLKQSQSGWQSTTTDWNLGGVAITDTTHWKGTPSGTGGNCVVTYDVDSGKVTITWS